MRGNTLNFVSTERSLHFEARKHLFHNVKSYQFLDTVSIK